MLREQRRTRIAVGITGATGAVFGIRILERLRDCNVETHLIASAWGRRTIEHETDYTFEDVAGLADVVHSVGNQAAPVSSGSFRMDGLIVAPCSVRTLAAIAHGLADNLITRCADVTLKERRTLVLMVREAPLSQIHLQNMMTLAGMGAVIYPPMPAFYSHPASIADLVDQITGRALDQLGFEPTDIARWDGHLDRPIARSDVHVAEG